MIHFAIIHATYRESPTIIQTMGSMHAAGIPYFGVSTDNGVLGAMRNVDKALRQLVSIAKEGDHVCVVDDDLAMCKDALCIMVESVKDNPLACHSFYTVAHTVRHLEPEQLERTGWVEITPNFYDAWGGMVVMPKFIAEDVLRHTYWNRYKQTDKVGKHCDAALYETLGRMKHNVRFHLPSLATDISGGSTTIETGNKEVLAGYRFNEWP